MPLDLVPHVAVLLEGTSLGVEKAVGIDEIDDVGFFDLEVITLGEEKVRL